MKPTIKVISIDFDGTIADDSDFPKIGKIMPGAKEAINNLSKDYKIVINSCRTSKMFEDHPRVEGLIKAMIKWLDDNGIKYDRINMGDEGKVVASAYIDNRAIRFNNNWEEIANNIDKYV